jgi:hypothetical protein
VTQHHEARDNGVRVTSRAQNMNAADGPDRAEGRGSAGPRQKKSSLPINATVITPAVHLERVGKIALCFGHHGRVGI